MALSHIGPDIQDIPIQSRTSGDVVPLTAMQRMPWNYRKIGRHARTEPFAIRMLGELNVALLQACLNALVRRHESLRTSISVINDVPCQCVGGVKERQFEFVKISRKGSDTDRVVQSCVQEFVDRKVDSRKGPLFDAIIVGVSERDHILLVSADHLITDGISNDILRSEVCALYSFGLESKATLLPRVMLQFADYAAWLEAIHPLWMRIHAAYWRARFTRTVPISWPKGCKSQAVGCVGWAAQPIHVGQGLAADLFALAESERTFPSVIMLSAYVAAVARWCGQYDLPIILVEGGRHRGGLVRTVGCVATHLHLRMAIRRTSSFKELLSLAKDEIHSATKHRDFDRVPSLLPEFKPDLLFNWLETSYGGGRSSSNESSLSEAGLKVEYYPVRVSQESISDIVEVLPHKLGLICSLAARELNARLSYRTDIFRADVIQRLAEELSSLLLEITQKALAEVAIVPDESGE